MQNVETQTMNHVINSMYIYIYIIKFMYSTLSVVL